MSYTVVVFQTLLQCCQSLWGRVAEDERPLSKFVSIFDWHCTLLEWEHHEQYKHCRQQLCPLLTSSAVGRGWSGNYRLCGTELETHFSNIRYMQPVSQNVLYTDRAGGNDKTCKIAVTAWVKEQHLFIKLKRAEQFCCSWKLMAQTWPRCGFNTAIEMLQTEDTECSVPNGPLFPI